MSRISNSNGVRTPAGPALLLAPCLLLAGGVLATAQDALRLSEPDGRSADAGRQAIADLTVADGSVRRWSAVSSMALGYSDNLSLAPAGSAIADGFVEPSQLLSYDWPLTERQRISLGATVTYRRHFSHSEHDRFTVAPGSQLRFVGRVGNVGVEIRDRFVLSEDPLKIGSAGSVSRFGGLNNLAGISLGYDLERTGFSMGFNRVDFISTVRESDLLSRAGHYVDAAVSMRFPQRFLAGVETTAGLTDFTLDGRRDNLNWSAGLFGRWFLGDHIVVEPRVGVVGYRFSENTDEEGQPDLDFYAQLTLRHRMTEHLRHELRFSRETSSAGAADLERYHLLSWNWTWQMNERLTASLAAFADAGTDLGGLTQVSYSRWGIEPAVQLRLGPRISARASAQVVMKDSKLENQDYAARILSVGMSYAF